jgi:DNA (cytosine-5)-methyltransferase 1
MLTIATLFSGGLDGFAVAAADRPEQYHLIWQCENDKFRQKMLTDAFDVPIYDDVTTLLSHNPPTPDVLVITSPCQNISVCGDITGINGSHSKLIFDAIKVISVLRPRYFIMENSTNITNTGLGLILAEISAMGGYDCEWGCVSAFALGSEITRDRWFLTATRACEGRRSRLLYRPNEVSRIPKAQASTATVTHLLVSRCKQVRDYGRLLEPDGLPTIPERYRFKPK